MKKLFNKIFSLKKLFNEIFSLERRLVHQGPSGGSGVIGVSVDVTNESNKLQVTRNLGR